MGLIFSAFCCCCQGISCAASLMTCCFRSATGTGGLSVRTAKLFYIIFLGIATILALVLRYQGDRMNFDFGVISAGCSDFLNETAIPTSASNVISGGGTYVYCKGDAAVMRISFVLTVFFICMLALSSISEEIFRGFWGFKIILYVLALIGCFFIPNWFFTDGYAWFARILSAFFLVLQLLMLIDFGYQWNEDWVQRAYAGAATEYDDATNKGWLVGILTAAVSAFLVTIAGIVLLFIYFTDGCDIGLIFTIILTIFTLVTTILALFRQQIVGEPGAILPAAVVSIYTTYVTWSALASAPNSEGTCGPDVNQDESVIIIGIIVAAISLMWTSFSATRNAENLIRGDENENITSSDTPFYRVDDNGTTKGANELDNAENGENTGSGEQESNDKHWIFFTLLTCASLYMAMLFTNWGVMGPGSANANVGEVSMWVKIVSAWLCSLLYLWTLIAPAVMKDREFS